VARVELLGVSELESGVGQELDVETGEASLVLTVSDANSTLENSYTLRVRRLGGRSQLLKASNADDDERFGNSAFIACDRLFVGAALEDAPANGPMTDPSEEVFPGPGAVFVFRREAAGWVQEAFLKPEVRMSVSLFGQSVSCDAGTLVIGAPGDENPAAGIGEPQPIAPAGGLTGAVYVYETDGSAWTRTAYVKAPNPDPLDAFGQSVAIREDVMVVGAPGESSGGGAPSINDVRLSGAAYLYERTGGEWAFVTRLTLPTFDSDSGDNLGIQVAIGDDVVAVGVPRYDGPDNGSEDSGGVAIFIRNARGEWQYGRVLRASNAGPGDGFGSSVAIDGRYLIVGAPGEDSLARGVNPDLDPGSADVLNNSGAVYVFDLEDQFREVAFIKAPVSDAGDRLGSRVAMTRGVLAVGAPGEASDEMGVDATGLPDGIRSSGGVFTFSLFDGSFREESFLKASNPGSGDRLGEAGLAVGIGVLVACAPSEDSIEGDETDDTRQDSGACYVFE
jgi:hypothetical protein